jgi:hypothetical protein
MGIRNEKRGQQSANMHNHMGRFRETNLDMAARETKLSSICTKHKTRVVRSEHVINAFLFGQNDFSFAW